MEAKDIEYFKHLLIQKRKEMQNHMDAITESERETTIKDASGDHSAFSFHMADQGTDTMEREKNFFYAQRDGKILAHIERALDRIERGEYGKCRACGEQIAFARLEAVPHATLCIQCKSNQEKTPDMLQDQGETV
ncbi:MAG TPA: TraR/DksA family transcriptional regulator [bacterium]|nr:TraR/DksA family transcriptional regulator [bacterium]